MSPWFPSAFPQEGPLPLQHCCAGITGKDPALENNINDVFRKHQLRSLSTFYNRPTFHLLHWATSTPFSVSGASTGHRDLKKKKKRPFARTETVLEEPPGERNPTNHPKNSLLWSSTAPPRAWFPRGWAEVGMSAKTGSCHPPGATPAKWAHTILKDQLKPARAEEKVQFHPVFNVSSPVFLGFFWDRYLLPLSNDKTSD